MYLIAIVFILKDLQKVEENRVKWENNAPKLPQKFLMLFKIFQLYTKTIYWKPLILYFDCKPKENDVCGFDSSGE